MSGLKKKLDISASEKVLLLEKDHPHISLKRQCELLGMARSTAYYIKHSEPDDEELLKALDEIYTSCPFYGKRKMVVELKNVPSTERRMNAPTATTKHPKAARY